jgi:hypothetical protein
MSWTDSPCRLCTGTRCQLRKHDLHPVIPTGRLGRVIPKHPVDDDDLLASALSASTSRTGKRSEIAHSVNHPFLRKRFLVCVGPAGR